MATKIVVSIAPQSREEFQEQYPQAKALGDIVEIRTDRGFIPDQSLAGESVLITGPCPEILQPMMLDVPYERLADVQKLKQQFPKTKILGSYHGPFENVNEIIQKLDASPVDFIKIACPCKNALEALELVSILNAPPTKKPLTIVPMGEQVSFGRVVAACLGSHLTFTCLDNRPVAPGQISAEEMIKRYRVQSITQLYGLIGSPVTRSPSYITHNHVFQSLNVPAAYVKIDLKPEEVEKAMPLLQLCRFRGLSVTMPLKGKFGPNPVNTIRINPSDIETFNTDGRSVKELLEEKVDLSRSTVLIIGAGGTAQAIAQALSKAGASLIISNRTEEKAEALAKLFGAQTCPFGTLPEVQVVIQATCSEDIRLPEISSMHVVLDVLFPDESPFLKECKKKGAKTISGLDMWKRQAAHQFDIWLGAKQ